MNNVNFTYTNLTPFKWYVLENFPFIEADFDALTNWQLFCKLGKEINKIIPAVNSVGAQTENLTTFVTNYFNNLDVQEEINNKLDQMVQDGTLQEIIASYIQLSSVLGYDTVENMKNATNLVDGSYAQTLGFYEKNDGGNGLYKIRTITNTDVIDNATIISINKDNLIAELICFNKINILTLGAKNDGVYDNTNIFNIALEKFNYILIPDGSYVISESINISSQKIIKGESLNSKLIYTGTNYLFNVSTDYNKPFTIDTLYIEGNNLNNCINSNKNSWGASFNLNNFTIAKFATALNIVSNYNNYITDGLIMCDGAQIISSVYNPEENPNNTFSNNLLFENVHFKKYSNDIDTLFTLNNAQYFNFINCTFEFCNLAFDLTRSKVYINNCWCEATNYLYKYNDENSWVKSTNSNLIITIKENFNAQNFQYGIDNPASFLYNDIQKLNTNTNYIKFLRELLNETDTTIYHRIRVNSKNYDAR